MAGIQFERQEKELLNLIENSLEKHPEITLESKEYKISNIVRASKFTGRQISGSEPYTDIQLTLSNNENVNLSLKGEKAPSLAGGGLRGINTIVPNLSTHFMNRSLIYCQEFLKLRPGDKVPNIFSEIPEEYKEKIVMGTEEIGGPIHYLYVGPMNISGKLIENTLQVNGSLLECSEFSRSKNLYFRLRARRRDQTFTEEISDGIPRIYGRSPTKGDIGGRLVVTEKLPIEPIIISL